MSYNSGSNRAGNFKIGLALRARPILNLLALLLPELYSTRSITSITVTNTENSRLVQRLFSTIKWS